MNGKALKTMVLATGLGLGAPGPAGAGIEAAIADQLVRYEAAYPEIRFVHLRGTQDWMRVVELPARLGGGAINLDYEHQSHLRETLVTVQLERIATMAANGWPSATLFRTGARSGFRRPFVCVITLDAGALAKDANEATRIMLGGRDPAMTGIRWWARLDNSAFAGFTVDHEVFHCLDAYLNGPTYTRTFDQMEMWYQRFRAEQRADLFAAAMHQRRRPQSHRFLRHLRHYRTLALLDGDIAHYSTPALNLVPAGPAIGPWPDSVRGLVLRTGRFADAVLPGRKAFARHLSAAYAVAHARGIEASVAAPPDVLAAQPVAETVRRRIQRQLEHAEAHVFQ